MFSAEEGACAWQLMRRFGFKMNVLRSCCPAASKSQGTFDLQDIWKHQIPSLILSNTTNASLTLDTRHLIAYPRGVKNLVLQQL
jgi:hypothetical protein